MSLSAGDAPNRAITMSIRFMSDSDYVEQCRTLIAFPNCENNAVILSHRSNGFLTNLAVAGNAQHEVEHHTDRTREQPAHDVEVLAELVADQRQDEQQAEEDGHAEGFEPRKRHGQEIRQQTHGDAASVER